MSHLYDQSPLGKGFSGDLFGRLKVSNGFTVFDSQNRYKISGDFANITTDASITYNGAASLVNLNVSANANSKVYYETKRIFPYQPGKSQQVLQTFVFNSSKANLRQRAGYFTTDNGFYLEQDSANVYLVRRSNSSGTITETRVAQSDWNQDALQGTGVSGYTLDLSKSQILWSEYEWLGVGSVKIGFAIDGKFIEVHQFNHANNLDTTYMGTASLPVRFEIENTGNTTLPSTLKQICATVISNGGYERYTEAWRTTRTSSISSVASASGWAPIVSIRLSSNRMDSVILPSDLSIVGDGNNIVYEWALLRNANIEGGAWLTHTPSNGNTEYNANATSLAGGTVVQSGMFTSTTQSTGSAVSLGEFRFDLQLGRDLETPRNSDTMTLAIRHLTAGGGKCFGSLGWLDLV